jgi:hypothetical protein
VSGAPSREKNAIICSIRSVCSIVSSCAVQSSRSRTSTSSGAPIRASSRHCVSSMRRFASGRA